MDLVARPRLRLSALIGVVAISILGAVASIQSAGATQADARSVRVAQWLGVKSIALNRAWSSVDIGGDHRYRASVAGVGMVDLNEQTLDVEQVIFGSELQRGAGPSVSLDSARLTAEQFARSHDQAFDAMVPFRVESIDHHSFREYSFMWRERAGDAWLPAFSLIGINQDSGHVATYFRHPHVPVTVSVAPRIDRVAALGAAQNLVRPAAHYDVSGPDLEVVTAMDGRQHLRWVVEFVLHSSAPAQISNNYLVAIDAETGAPAIVAKG